MEKVHTQKEKMGNEGKQNIQNDLLNSKNPTEDAETETEKDEEEEFEMPKLEPMINLNLNSHLENDHLEPENSHFPQKNGSDNPKNIDKGSGSHLNLKNSRSKLQLKKSSTKDRRPDFGARKQQRKNYECLYCSKLFIRPSHLERHVRIHTGEQPFHCSICPKKYNTKREFIILYFN